MFFFFSENTKDGSHRWSPVNIPYNENLFTIKELAPSSLFEIRMSSLNAYGESATTDVMHVQTGGKLCSCNAVIAVTNFTSYRSRISLLLVPSKTLLWYIRLRSCRCRLYKALYERPAGKP